MKKEQSIRKIGKLILAISSCGVLLTAFQANKSVFAEDATTTTESTTVQQQLKLQLRPQRVLLKKPVQK